MYNNCSAIRVNKVKVSNQNDPPPVHVTLEQQAKCNPWIAIGMRFPVKCEGVKADTSKHAVRLFIRCLRSVSVNRVKV